MASSSNAEVQQQENAPAGFQSVLRLRPLSKKEREEHIVLEPTSKTTAVLHPLPPLQSELVSSSSSTAAQSIPSEQFKTGHDVEFCFDTVFPSDASQEKVYFSLGHTMAQSAMEPLKTLDPDSVPRKTNLLIAMGLPGSGKSFSCWGDGVVSKRKIPGDGLVPRVIDSLFSQSKHHVSRMRGHSFSVNMTFLQVDQSKSKPTESTIRDLLHPVARKIISIPHTGLGLSSPSSIHNLISPNTASRTESGGSNQSGSIGSYSSLDDPVSVEQDPLSSDCLLVNGQVRMSSTVEDARLTLQTAMMNRNKLKNKKHDSHVFVQMQPVIVNRSGKPVWAGGRIAVLDMASLNHQATSGKKPRTGRIKDTIPNRPDAHTAVLHCLRSIQNNQNLQVEDESPNGLQKVPYLRHKVTMLLQPLFSANYTDYTLVTLFLASYPGYRDHAEKLELLQELQALHRPLPTRGAVTGMKPCHISSKRDKLKSSHHEKTPGSAWDADDEGSDSHNKERSRRASKERFNNMVPQPGVMPGVMIERSSSMTYSESSVEDGVVPLPPPVAPGYKPSLPQACFSSAAKVWAPGASAPYEDAVFPRISSTSKPSLAKPQMPEDPPTRASAITWAQTKKHHPSPSGDQNSVYSACGSSEDENASPFEAADDGFVSAQPSSAQKFSYMKTFTNVVSVSKKKSRQVLEKMTVSTISHGNEQNMNVDRKYEERLRNLEIKNDTLEKEIAVLREQNETLQNENEALKREKEQAIARADPDDYSERASSPPAMHQSMFDNPLFQHMAHMNQQSTNAKRW